LNESRKEEIIMATLDLASKIGLGAVSMNMIAEKIGIKKPSLYNHFSSKEELIGAMYEYLRERAKANANVPENWDSLIPSDASASSVLKMAISNYINITEDENILRFYRVVYSERTISKDAAKILLEESNKMIAATKVVFEFLANKKLLHFDDVYTSAEVFALTIHGIMDYEMDKSFASSGKISIDKKLIYSYIDNFCEQNKVGK